MVSRRRTWIGRWSRGRQIATFLGGVACAVTVTSAALFIPTPVAAQEGEAPPAAQEPGGIAYSVTITVDGGEASLPDLIAQSSNLKALESDPPSGPLGLVRRAQSDFPRIQKVLNSEAYFGGLIDIRVAGVPVANQQADEQASAAAAARQPAPVTVDVQAGPQFVIGTVTLVDAATGGPPLVPIDRAKIGLEPGSPAKGILVIDAETRIVDAMQNLGYPLAAVPRRQAIADHSSNTLDVTFYLSPGRQADIGPVQVRGAEGVNADFIARQAGVKPGTRYSPEEIRRIRENITDLGAFQSVRIVEGDEITADGQIPLFIEVEERKPRFVGLGASYSSTDGATFNGYWGHRNLFGNAEKLRIEGEVSRLFENSLDDLTYLAKATFEKPGFVTPIDDLLAEARAFRETPDAYTSTGAGATATWRRRFTDRFEGRVGVEIEHAEITDAFGTNTYTLVGVPISGTYDSTDNKLDPTRGIRASLQAEPFPKFLGSSLNMTVFKGFVSAYHAMDEAQRFVLAGRVEAGTIQGPDTIADIPADRRFYAGGGGSIRGYDFQGVSPRLPNGQIVGGKSLFVASAEMRLKITETIGIVPFVDMGGAFVSSTPDFDSNFKIGAGIGLRYYTAIGPIRFDVAVPLDKGPYDPSVAFYVGLGQAF